MSKLYKFHSVEELLVLAEEYRTTNPERDNREEWTDAGSPAETYYLGVVDFLQWLANGKQFLYEEEVDTEFDIQIAEDIFLPLDEDEEENIQRDETY